MGTITGMQGQAIRAMNYVISKPANLPCAIQRLCCAIVILALSTSPARAFAGGMAFAPLSPFGIEVSGGSGSLEFDRVQQAGAQWTRLAGLWWPSVEPEEGKYNWSAMQWLEALFIQARDRGLTPILIVRGTPAWAQQIAGVECGPIRADKLTAFADFMAAVVQRYGIEKYNVKYWELGNEPDIDHKLVDSKSETGCWGDDSDAYYGGGAYAEMLKVIYPRIKQVDPSATVLVGGLVLDCDPRPGGGCPNEARSKPPRFLEGILRAGGGAYFDAVSYHSYDYYDRTPGRYGNSNWSSDIATTGPVSVVKAAYIRELLVKYVAGNKRLFNTEDALLCNACMDDPGYEWTKALYAANLNVSTVSTRLSASIWFRLKDWPGTALVDADMTPTHAYDALRASAMQLTDAVVERALSSDETGDAGLRGVLLTRGTEQTWVVWAVDGAAHTLKLSANPRAVHDVLGQPVETKSTTIEYSAPNHLLFYITW